MQRTLKITKEIALAIFILSTIFPGISRDIISVLSIAIWLMTNFILDTKGFINFFIKPNWLMYSIYFWLLTNIIYMITGYDNGMKGYITNYIRIGITVIIYLYYWKNEEKKSMKAILIYSLVMIIVVNIITILANVKEYNISRMLATGTIKEKIGVGSYTHIYGLIFPTLILIAYLIRDIKKVKLVTLQKKLNIQLLVDIFFIISALITIAITEFSTAIILLIIGILFIIFKISNMKRLLTIMRHSCDCFSNMFTSN